jgi:hydroxymethylglutaryl-CoA lyase
LTTPGVPFTVGNTPQQATRLNKQDMEAGMMDGIDVLVSEVGPRDGLQNTRQFMPTEYKKKWISAAAEAGLREIEVCSFVPPRLIPQMADAAEIVAHARTIPGLHVAALAPNFKGAQRAMEAGVHKLTLTISVSESHSLANVRMTPDEAIASARKICEFRDSLPLQRRPKIESGLSTVFGCTIEGAVSEDEVVRMAVASVEAGCDEVGLADTTGYANPEQIRRVFRKVRAAIGDKLSGAHLHNTRGLGLANVVAALEVGVTTFDSSLGGLGGCPFAPGASGNIVTEDLVFMLESMGLRTGINLDKLLAMRTILEEGIPGEPLYGYVPLAGVTKGFVPASAGK